MIVQRYTFSVSEEALAFRRWLSIGVLAPPIGLLLYHAVSRRKSGQLTNELLVLGLVFLAFVLIGSYSLRNLKRRKLHVRPEGIFLETGRWQEVPWERISRIRVHQDSHCLPRVVEIFTGPELALQLSEHESMPDIVRLVQEGLPANAQVEVKETKWAGRSVLLFFLAGVSALSLIVLPLAFGWVERQGGNPSVLDDLLGVGTGVYLIFASRFDSRLDQEARRTLLFAGLLFLALHLGPWLLGASL
jgi:hypothetical protein